MADARVIARQVGVSEKDMMMQSLTELKSDVKKLLSDREKLGVKNNNESIGEILDEVYKNKKNKETPIEEIVEDIVKKYAKQQDRQKEELIAQLDSKLAVFKNKLKTPGSYAASSAFEGASTLVNDKRTNVNYNQVAADSIRGGLSSMFKSLQTLTAPKLSVNKSKDEGQNNPGFDANSASVEKSYDSVVAKILTAKNAGNGSVKNLLKALETYQEVDKEKAEFINSVVKKLSSDEVLKQDKKGRSKKNKEETIEEMTDRLEQAQYNKENKEKKELIASLDAKTEINKKKYFTDIGTTSKSLTSDAFGSASSVLDDKSTNVDYNAKARDSIGGFFSKKFKQASILSRPWHEKSKKDEGQDAPDVDENTVEKNSLDSILDSVSDIRSKVSEEDQEDESEDTIIDDIYDEIAGETRRSSKINENVSDVEDAVYSLDGYVRHHLASDIAEELGRQFKESKANTEGSQPSEKPESSDQEGEEDEDGESSFGKWGKRLKKGGQWLKKGGSLLKNIGSRGGSMAMNGLRMLGSGSAMGGAAVVALGAASAYTFYETGKTAMAISEGKEQVRNSTKGSAEASIAKNQEKTTKDSPGVKAGANRYEKAGLTKDESLSTSLAERQNSKMLTSAASMSGIFGAARHSTDFRSSEEEVNTLLEGETLADTIRSGLQGLQSRLADPESVKNMSPGEIRGVQNQAKVTIKQIADLKKTWEDAKKKGTGFLNSQWLKDESLVGNGDALIDSLSNSGKDIEDSFNEWAKEMESGAKSRTEKKNDKKSEKAPEKKDETVEKPVDKPPEQKTEQKTDDKKSMLDGFDSAKRRDERKARYERLKAEGRITGDADIDAETMIMEERQEKMQKEAGIEPPTKDKTDAPESTEDEFGSRMKALEKAGKTGVIEPPKGYRELTQEEKDAKFKHQQELRKQIGQIETNTKPKSDKLGEELKTTIADSNSNILTKIDTLISKVEKITPQQQTAPMPQTYELPPDNGFVNINSLAKGA